MYNRAIALNLLLHIVLLLYILRLRKTEKDLSEEQDVTGRVPRILKAVLIIGKHGKLMDFSFVLTLSGRQVCSDSNVIPKGVILILVFSYLSDQSLLHKILENF